MCSVGLIGFNNSALNKYVVPESVNEWVRNIVANRLAANGSEWVGLYSKYNSGTYNNQNMVCPPAVASHCLPNKTIPLS